MRPIPLVSLLAFAVVATADVDGCPKDLKAVVSNYNDGVAAKLPRVHSVLTRCPQLATVDIRFDLSGCVTDDTPLCIPFALSGCDHVPSAPEAVSLTEYELEHREWHHVWPRWACKAGLRRLAISVYNAVKWRDWEELENSGAYWWFEGGYARRWFAGLVLPKRQRLKTNLELWLDAMDFSRVRHLALIRCRWSVELLVDKLLPRVPALRSLEIAASASPDQAGLVRFLAPNTLEHLSLRDTFLPWDQIQPLVAQHGQSLTSLEWHSHEWAWDDDAPVLSPADLGGLRGLAPGLRALTINLKRNGTAWPWAGLDALRAGAPAGLANLTLYFSREFEASGCTRLDAGAAARMFRRLVAGDDEAATTTTTTTMSTTSSWHTVRFFSVLSHGDSNIYGSDGLQIICSTWRPDGSPKASGEPLCVTSGYSPLHCDVRYAELAFEQRQEVLERLRMLWCHAPQKPSMVRRNGCFNYCYNMQVPLL